MRISDWSSDVCSSDLLGVGAVGAVRQSRQLVAWPHAWPSARVGGASRLGRGRVARGGSGIGRNRGAHRSWRGTRLAAEIGRASCWDRVCQYVSIAGVPVSLKNKKEYSYYNYIDRYN